MSPSLLNGSITCLFVRLSMIRRDIVDIFIVLSSASTPLISSCPFSLPSTFFRDSLLLLPFINPSSFLPLFSVASLLSSTCRSCFSFFRVPPYFCFPRHLPRSFLFSSCLLYLYPVIISSPFLFVFFTDLLLFSAFLFFLRYFVYLPVVLSSSILFHLLSLLNLSLQPLSFSIFMYFLYSSVSFLFSFILFHRFFLLR